MTRNIGTVARGVRCPIIRQGDNLSEIVVNSVIEAAKTDGFELRDRDVIGITESIVARSQGNYASIDAIGKDVRNKFGGDTVGVIFPILSRNRFAICLKGDRKSTRLNSSHANISYAVFCLKKKSLAYSHPSPGP